MLLNQIVEKESIHKGWSGDRKYRATDENGNVYLLRISPADQLIRKQALHHRMQEIEALGIHISRSLECGLCPEGVYILQIWIDGQDAEEVIPTLDPGTQYELGLDAGRSLQKLHTLPAPADAEDWAVRFNRKIDRKIAMYESCPLKYEGGEAFLRHIANSRHLLEGRPQNYQHGDYHIGNMMVDRNGQIIIIDFDREDYGDPWEEFNRIVWCAQASPRFASGLVDGYFDGPVPKEFWDLLALYICSNTLSSLPWAIPFGEREITTMKNQAREVLSWYDHMNTTIPSWYCGK